MKISKSVKIVAGIALLAPLAMYASDGTPADITMLNNAYATVKTAFSGPIKGFLLIAEFVSGAWLFKQNKEVSYLVGTPIVMAATALVTGAL